MVDRRTTACTMADKANPRISAQAISHVIEPAIDRAWMIACMLSAYSPGWVAELVKYPWGVS